jgi:hypothetical protein
MPTPAIHDHLYTLHSSYLGRDCAICSKGMELHKVTEYLNESKKIILLYEDPFSCIGEMK